MADQPLTRGQKAAATRRKNKAKAAAENPQTFVKPNDGKTITASMLGNLLSSVDDIQQHVYGTVQKAELSVMINGMAVTAIYDGQEWRFAF